MIFEWWETKGLRTNKVRHIPDSITDTLIWIKKWILEEASQTLEEVNSKANVRKKNSGWHKQFSTL